jgi:hypothetical protein
MNGRKARQLRSQGGQRRFRRGLKKNRATAAEFNAAVAATEAEYHEMEAAHEALLEQLQAEPQFAIVSPFTGEVVMLAALSMIHPLDTSALEPETADPEKPSVIAPEGALIDDGERLRDEGWGVEIVPEGPKIILPGTAEALGVNFEDTGEFREDGSGKPAHERWPNGAPT